MFRVVHDRMYSNLRDKWRKHLLKCANIDVLKPKFRYADFLETSPWHDVSRGRFGEVDDLSRGSRGHGSCYGEDTGKFRGFKPSWHVEMVWKNPVTSRRQARLRRSNGIWKRARRHDKRTFARRCTPGDKSRISYRCDVIVYVFRLCSLLGRTVWRKPM